MEINDNDGNSTIPLEGLNDNVMKNSNLRKRLAFTMYDMQKFYMRFGYAITSERYKELLADNDTLNTMPRLRLHRDIEKHGREVYTHENVYIFQGVWWSAWVDYGVEGTQ
ncbi:hypothetical protein CR513_57940, partial [Mucuna pruriens]